jgi:hypothetical protein
MQTRPCKYGRAAALCILLTAVFPAQAQVQTPEGREARVYFAEGGDFVLADRGRRTVYRPETLGDEGFTLNNGDIIQTGPGTFVEIRLMPRDTIIKAAENTTLIYRAGDGGVSLELDYGRVRLLDRAGAAGEPLTVQAGTSEFVFRSGDGGVDYMVLASDSLSRREPQFQAYVFSGAADMILRAAGSPAEETVFSVRPMEMAVLDMARPLSYIERRPLDQEIADYWERHRPSEIAPPAPEVSAVPVEEAAPAGYAPAALPDYQAVFTNNKIKNGFVIGGMTLFALGAGMESLAWFVNFDSPNTKDVLMYTGYGFFGLGLISLGTALFFNPPLPVSDGSD